MAITDSLISFWELEEASGTRNDSHGTNHLTDNATVTSGTGKVGTGAVFAVATQEYLSRADNASLSTGDIDFTVFGWFKPTAAALTAGSTGSALVTKLTSGGVGEWHLRLDANNGTIRFAIWSSSVNRGEVSRTAAAAADTWIFIVAQHDSVNNLVGISINGDAITTIATTGAPADTATGFTIGGWENPGVRNFDGTIDQVGFSKRLFTADEITWLFNSGNGRSYAEMATTLLTVNLTSNLNG